MSAITYMKTACESTEESLMRIWYAVAAGTAPSKITSQAMSGLVHLNGVATATFAADHQLRVGDKITLTGVPEAGYNGTYTVLTVPSTTTLTFQLNRLAAGGLPVTPATASAATLCDVSLPFMVALLVGRKVGRFNNTGVVFVGQTSVENGPSIEVTVGGTRELNAPVGRHLNLDKFWIDCVTAADGITVHLMQ